MNMDSFYEGSLWKVVNIQDKGLGVIAKSSIPKGTLILQDCPLFIVPHSAHTDNPEDLNKYLEAQVNNLTENDRTYFYSLADCKVEEDQILDCFNNNVQGREQAKCKRHLLHKLLHHWKQPRFSHSNASYPLKVSVIYLDYFELDVCLQDQPQLSSQHRVSLE